MTVNIGQGLLNAVIYMLPMAIIAGLVCMYLWERTCRKKIKIVLIKTAGGTVPSYVNKEGDSVTLSNKDTGWSGTWPINSLSTIPQPYPDLAGLLPRFLQREIQVAIFIEGDLEPVLNRSAHRSKVMSPDVYKYLKNFVEEHKDDDKIVSAINGLLDGVSTGLSRELIASPEWISALRKSTALKALASVSDDLMEALKQIRNQLARFSGLNSTYVYIGLVFILILLGVNLYYTVQSGQSDLADMKVKIDAIHRALGITQ